MRVRTKQGVIRKYNAIINKLYRESTAFIHSTDLASPETVTQILSENNAESDGPETTNLYRPG